MKKNVIRIVVAVVLISVIVGVYYWFTVSKRATVEDAVELTEGSREVL